MSVIGEIVYKWFDTEINKELVLVKLQDGSIQIVTECALCYAFMTVPEGAHNCPCGDQWIVPMADWSSKIMDFTRKH